MWLLVGLGNPGAGYARHRHNVGFMAVDALAERASPRPSWRNRFQGETAEIRLGDERCLLLKPQTFMNLSGEAVRAAVQFLKIPVDRVIAFHDELDVGFGRLKVKQGGGAAGHNGLRSMDQHIGQAYWRVRLGIGHPGHKDLVSGYVLHDFSAEERAHLPAWLGAVAAELPALLAGKPNDFAARVTQLVPPPVEARGTRS